jgi:type VI secretion system protein ImpH
VTGMPPPLAQALTAPPRALLSAIDRLLASPHEFGFFQAMRLMERWLTHTHGLGDDAALQRVRWHNDLSLAFPASEIADLHRIDPAEAGLSGDAPAIAITPAFMGLTGGAGTLPAYYTELLLQREHIHKDGAARAFLDIFLQRAGTLLYQAWRKQRLALRHEHAPQKHFLPQVLSIAGVGQGALRGRLQAERGGIADQALAFYAQHLQRRTVSAQGLAQLLSQYFAVPVQVTPLVGRWFNLGAQQQTRLGLGQATLGRGALVGGRVWQRDQCVGLRLGPMPRAKLHRFLPGQPGAIALREWLQLLTGLSLEFDVRLCLQAADVSPALLGGGAQLGHDAFLITRPSQEDRQEPGYALMAA